MKMERPSDSEITPEEQEHLNHLRAVIEGATADGVLTEGEIEQINTLINADHQVTFGELELVRTLIREKLGENILIIDRS